MQRSIWKLPLKDKDSEIIEVRGGRVTRILSVGSDQWGFHSMWVEVTIERGAMGKVHASTRMTGDVWDDTLPPFIGTFVDGPQFLVYHVFAEVLS